MTHTDLANLHGLHSETDDPWNFRGSPYEAERFASVARALPKQRYEFALEIGCGNGELARFIAPRCASYKGIDAVPIALEAALIAVPSALFVEAFVPCRLPKPPVPGGCDLVLLSEVLYFLDRTSIARIAEDVDRDHPDADLVTVAWRGETGHTLSGDDAVVALADASSRRSRTVRQTEGYRIEVFAPLRGIRP